MWNKLKGQWQAEETKIGILVKNYIGKGLALCAAVGFSMEQFSLIPQDYIPTWLKSSIAFMAVLGYVGGKLTKKENAADDKAK